MPLYYRNRDEGVPEEWMRRVKTCLKNLSPRFAAMRMVLEYNDQFYEMAHQAYKAVRESNYDLVRERGRWQHSVAEAWDRVRFLEVGPPLDDPVFSGRPIPLQARMELGGLKADDVRVEAVIGRINPAGYLVETEVLALPPQEQNGTVAVFGREFLPQCTGRLGYSIRVSPNHREDPLTRSANPLLKWG